MSMSPETRALMRKAIVDACTEAGVDGVAIRLAADKVLEALEPIIASIHENARGLGNLQGQRDAYNEVMLERTDEEEPFVAGLLREVNERLEKVGS